MTLFSDINEKLIKVKGDLRKKQKYAVQIEDFQKELEAVEGKLSQLQDQFKSDQEDVNKLESMSLTNLFATLSGTKDEKLSKEKKVLLATKHRLGEVLKTKLEIEGEISEISSKLDALSKVEEDYQQLLVQKEALIKVSDSKHADKVMELTEQEGNLRAYIEELNEAISAGELVEHALLDAEKSLEKASNWGTADILGGGTISGFVKHQHIDDAEDYLHDAQTHMRKFQKELLDVQEEAKLEVDISGLLMFADFFFDGFIVDFMVQGRINDALDETREQYDKVTEVLNKLEKQVNEKKEEVELVQKEKKFVIEEL
jgi:chromosome segregation ATPase